MGNFTDQDTWRVFRIMAEFIEGFEEMAGVGRAVTVFGSARLQPGDETYELAVQVGEKLARAGFSVITGGGPGIMEAANRGASKGGGQSIGIGIDLPQEQGQNAFVQKQIYFRYFFVRKVMLLKYAHGSVVMPGGYGTLDELFEMLTLIQTEKTPRIPIALMGTEHYRGLIDWLRGRLLERKLIDPGDLDLFLLTDDPDEAVEHICANAPDLADAAAAGRVPSVIP